MKYWVIKEKRSKTGLQEWVPIGGRDPWHTAKPPKLWLPGDRLFFWLGSPDLQLIRLGELEMVGCHGADEAEQTIFEVRYLVEHFKRPLGITELREFFGESMPSFLKAGPAGTLYPLHDRQAGDLYRLIAGRNREVKGVWADLEPRYGRARYS